MKTDLSLFPLIAAGAIYVFGVIMLSLHLVRSFAVLTVQNNGAGKVLEQLLEF
jgi:hypothetical protein